MDDMTWIASDHTADPLKDEPPVTDRAPATVNLTGGTGPSFLAYMQNFTFVTSESGGVTPRQVPQTDLAPAEDGRFVSPSAGWEKAREKLASHGIVVLVAEQGSGRRTAGLSLLAKLVDDHRKLADLDRIGPQLNAESLPKVGSCGFILDLSDPPEEADPNLGSQLATYGVEGRDQGRFLVVLSTRAAWSGEWTRGAEAFRVELGSPDARRLVETELRVLDMGHRLDALDDPRLEDIWVSRPRAENARRLAQLIAAADEVDLPKIIGEFQDWKDHIEELMGRGEDASEALGVRAVLWACAFNDGGTRNSVIWMADELLRQMGVPRGPEEILGGPTSSKRLNSASLKPDGSLVYLDPECHGLADALRLHLWREFSEVLERLRTWISQTLAKLRVEEATRVVEAAVHLAIKVEDNQLLTSLRDLTAPRLRRIVVATLSTAALDSSYVRARLYAWLTRRPSQETIDLVAEICGASLGIHNPAAAIVRLGRAASASAYGSASLTQAFAALAQTHPDVVHKALKEWMTEPRMRRAGQVAFIALASDDKGSNLILGPAGERLQDAAVLETAVTCWRAVFSDPASRPAAKALLEYWEARVRQGTLKEKAVVAVTAKALSHGFQESGIEDLLPELDDIDRTSLRWKIFTETLAQGRG